MEALYISLGHWSPGTLEELWQKWLWGCDCNAPPLEQCCDMNQMHILGLMCCLGESKNSNNQSRCINAETVPGVPVVHLHPSTPISSFSLRQFFDQLECLQLNWGPVLSCYFQSVATSDAEDEDEDDHMSNNSNDEKTAKTNMMIMHPLQIIKVLMARLGEIAHHAYATDGPILDDPQHTTPLPPSASVVFPVDSNNNNHHMVAPHPPQHTSTIKQKNHEKNKKNVAGVNGDKEETEIRLSIILRKSLRQAICILFSLLRVHSILSRCEQPPSTLRSTIKQEKTLIIASFKQHHIESSMDLFSELQQITHLAPGMRLVYRTNFTGMYNHVSQVNILIHLFIRY